MRIASFVLVALLYAALVWSSAVRQSVTNDEAAHLPAGYTYLMTGDFRLNPEHPPLAKLVCALPLLAMHLRLPIPSPGWTQANEWTFGQAFLAANKRVLLPMMAWARLPMALLTGVLVAVTGWWAAEVYGLTAGIVAMVVLGANPEVLDHGRWVTTDMPACALGFFTLYATWRWLGRPRLSGAVAMGLLLGAAVASKDSCLILPPLMLVQALGWKLSARPLPSPRQWAVAVLACTLGTAGVLMACYESVMGPILYVRDLALVNANHMPFYLRYLMGHMKYGTYPQYFLAAWILKTPFPLFVFEIAAIGGIIATGLVRTKRPPSDSAEFWDGAAILACIVGIFALMTWKADDIGVRYVLPAAPLLAWLCARAFARASRLTRIALVLLAVWGVADAARAWPDLGGAFDEFLPGPTVAYLDDSNVDWGQGLLALRTFMREHGLATIGYGSPSEVVPEDYGLRVDRSAGLHYGLLGPGWYAFSPNFLLRMPGYLWLAHVHPTRDADGLWIYHLQGNPRALAHETYARLIQSRRRDPYLWYHVAAFEQAEGNLAGAQTDLDAALSLWPGFLQARTMRAQVRTELGDRAGARSDRKTIKHIVGWVLSRLAGRGPGTLAGLLQPLGR